MPKLYKLLAVLVSGVVVTNSAPSYAGSFHRAVDCHSVRGAVEPESVACLQGVWYQKPICRPFKCKTKKPPKYRFKM